MVSFTKRGKINTCSKLNICLYLNISNKTRHQTQVQPLKIILDRITIGNIIKKAEEKKIAFMKSCRPRITIKYCTHQLIQKTIKYPLIQFRLRKKKKKKHPLFPLVSILGMIVWIFSPPHLPLIFFFFTINYRPSSHCFRFPLESWELRQLPLTIPNSYYRKNKSQKQKVLPTTSPMYKANGKQIQ